MWVVREGSIWFFPPWFHACQLPARIIKRRRVRTKAIIILKGYFVNIFHDHLQDYLEVARTGPVWHLNDCIVSSTLRTLVKPFGERTGSILRLFFERIYNTVKHPESYEKNIKEVQPWRT
jgi:hypothetical protein